MITSQEKENLRQELLTEKENYERLKHEELMKTNWEYFCKHSNLDTIRHEIKKLKDLATTYRWEQELLIKLSTICN